LKEQGGTIGKKGGTNDVAAVRERSIKSFETAFCINCKLVSLVRRVGKRNCERRINNKRVTQ
jgi:hypothetical protein